MSETPMKGTFDINASIRIIRHISGGIYRNPATAMKELIVNSFDADATSVDMTLRESKDISSITISDNGDGLTKDDMLFSFTHVGSSLKKLEPKKFESTSRPIVGQFGVGFLAAAHASTNVEILTTPKSGGYTLKVNIDLSPFFKFEKQIETLEEFTYGTVKYEKLVPASRPKGTTITLSRIGVELESRRFWERLNSPGEAYFGTETEKSIMESFGEDGPKNRFTGFVKWIDEEYSQATIDRLRGYEQFVWQLGLLLPVEYMDEGPIRSQYLKKLGNTKEYEDLKRIVRRMKEKLTEYDFHVHVDGIELKKPILLPTNIGQKGEELAHGEWDAFPIKYRKGSDSAEGYLFFQPYRVRPMELRGIFARLKGIGVGQYDNTVFRSIRTSTVLPFQLSGELNLEDGFDDSLNLDRSGFIETDAAYIGLSRFLLQRLESEEDAIIKQVWQTKGARKSRQDKEKLDEIRSSIKEAFSGFEVKAVNKKKFGRLQHVDGDYAILKISNKEKYIAVINDYIGEKNLVRVLLAIDYFIKRGGIGKQMAEQLRRAVRDALIEEG